MGFAELSPPLVGNNLEADPTIKLQGSSLVHLACHRTVRDQGKAVPGMQAIQTLPGIRGQRNGGNVISIGLNEFFN
jgi:hypothetical protein